MTDSVSLPSSILVDVELPEPEPLPSALIRVLSSLRVVLLGWYAVPEQTSPEQARDQFGDEARAALAEIAQDFEAAGAEVTPRLVFTGNKFDSLGRISTEEDCDAVLIPSPMDRDRLQRVLVPLRGLHNARRIAPFVADLIQDHTTDVTLLHILEEDETEDASLTNVLEPAAEMMREHGIDAGLLRLEALAADDPADTIVDQSSEYDLAVLGETKPSIRDVLFGTVPEQIAKKARVPIIVVRHEEEAVEMAERATQAD
jgi:nucleotide-binding universal stress UspA family protein